MHAHARAHTNTYPHTRHTPKHIYTHSWGSQTHMPIPYTHSWGRHTNTHTPHTSTHTPHTHPWWNQTYPTPVHTHTYPHQHPHRTHPSSPPHTHTHTPCRHSPPLGQPKPFVAIAHVCPWGPESSALGNHEPPFQSEPRMSRVTVQGRRRWVRALVTEAVAPPVSGSLPGRAQLGRCRGCGGLARLQALENSRPVEAGQPRDREGFVLGRVVSVDRWAAARHRGRSPSLSPPRCQVSRRSVLCLWAAVAKSHTPSGREAADALSSQSQ